MADKETPLDTTPSQAAEAAISTLLDSQAKESQRKFEESFDIVDPGQPKPTEEAAPEAKEPKTIPGAKVETGPSPELLERAASFGYTAEEAKQIPEGVLRKTLSRLEETQRREPEPQYQAPPQYDDKGNYWDGRQWHLAKPKTELPRLTQAADGTEFDPAIQAAIDARDKHYQTLLEEKESRLAKIEQAVQQQQQHFQAQRAQEDFRTMEALFQEDKDYSDVFGEGSLDNVMGTPKAEARRSVAVLMQDMANGYLNRGEHVPQAKTLYERAKVALYGVKEAQRATRDVADRLRDRAGQFISRPTATHRNSELPKGEERAVSKVAELMRQQERNGN